MSGRRARGFLPAAIAAVAALVGQPAAAAPATTFPIAISADGRGFVDAGGAPVRLYGDAAWSLIAALTLPEAERYLADRAARGFNAVLVNLIESRFSPNPPANAAGEAPFLAPGDFARPNAAYFDHAVRVIEAARANGLLVLLAPAYAGVNGGDQGWWSLMEKAGPAALARYGAFVADRLGHLDNVVFVHGGDFDPPDRRLVRAIADALEAGAPNALQTIHSAREVIVSDAWGSEGWLDFDTIYTYESVREAVLAQAARATGRPYLLIESLYENEHETSGRRLRAQAWEAVLGGAAGYVFGASPIWHFGDGWEAALDSPGAGDVARLAAILEDAPCAAPTPDPGVSALLAGRGTGRLRASLASCADGAPGARWTIAWLPRAEGVAVDVSGFPDGVSARWLDPTGAKALPAGTAAAGEGRLDLADPGPNARGDADWVLLLRSADDGGGEQ